MLSKTKKLKGYKLDSLDGEFGKVKEFYFDDRHWTIRYLVAMSESNVFINLSREAIKESPEYTEEFLLTRDYETGLHRHYTRPGYWSDEPAVHELSH